MNTFSSPVLTIKAHSRLQDQTVKIGSPASSAGRSRKIVFNREIEDGGSGCKLQPYTKSGDRAMKIGGEYGEDQKKSRRDVRNSVATNLWRSGAVIRT